MLKKLILGAIGMVAFAGTASAVPVYIGTSLNGAGIITRASGNGSAVFAGAVGGYGLSITTGSADPNRSYPDFGTSENASSFAGTTDHLRVFVTETGLTNPLSTYPLTLFSSFANSLISAGYTLSEYAYIDAGNGIFASTTLLGSYLTQASASGATSSKSLSVTNPFSITVVYDIVGTGVANGSIDGTISLARVPEPASLGILGASLAGIGMIRRRKARAA